MYCRRTQHPLGYQLHWKLVYHWLTTVTLLGPTATLGQLLMVLEELEATFLPCMQTAPVR